MKNDFIPALSTDWLTPFYDRVIESMGWGRALKRRVLQEIHLTAGERLLDIGCGTGTLLLEAVRETPGAHLTGIDPDPQILALAQRKLQAYPMELVQASAEQLPFPPMSFDVVVSTLVFHHLPIESKRRAIAEIARVLTAEGHFLLADMGPATTLPFKVLTALLLSLATLVHLKEARSARENLQESYRFFSKRQALWLENLYHVIEGFTCFSPPKTGSEERERCCILFPVSSPRMQTDYPIAEKSMPITLKMTSKRR